MPNQHGPRYYQSEHRARPTIQLSWVAKFYAAGYVDETEHYGKSIEDLIIKMKELNVGSHATGIGFSSAKFAAFSSNGDQAVLSLNTHVFSNGIQVTGWDICKGGTLKAILPRAYADTTETLFGKR